MPTIIERNLPLVSISDFEQGDTASKQAFVQQLGDAFHNIGFVGVTNHGISKQLITDYFAAAETFFALPDESKRKHVVPGADGQRGYTAFGTEKAKQSNVADLKEYFQLGREAEDSKPDDRNPRVPEVPEFVDLGMQLYRAFERMGNSLLRAIALHLGLPEGYFEEHTRNGVSILRAVYYPPIRSDPASAIRSQQHEDINLITLLVGASAGGLQLLDAEGAWKEVVPENDEILINVGDMLQRLTNNYLKSTTHRVVNPPREEWHKPRLSIPFFLHPRPEMCLNVLESCVTKENPQRYPPTTARDYLDERLREIGLKK